MKKLKKLSLLKNEDLSELKGGIISDVSTMAYGADNNIKKNCTCSGLGANDNKATGCSCSDAGCSY